MILIIISEPKDKQMGALLSACLDRPLTETEKKELDAVEQVVVEGVKYDRMS